MKSGEKSGLKACLGIRLKAKPPKGSAKYGKAFVHWLIACSLKSCRQQNR
jgi:hypothetical protein